MGQRWNWGLDKNCVGLSPWGKNVPGEVVNKVETVKMDWVNDKMGTYYPFDQGVTKQDGSKIEGCYQTRTWKQCVLCQRCFI